MSAKKFCITSIDIGRKNMAVCMMECFTRKILFWKNFDLRLKAYNPYTYRKRLERLFLSLPPSSIYVIERQMFRATKNCFIECILHCLVTYCIKKKAVSANPKTVAKYFQLREGKYYKKKDAVHVAKQILLDNNNAGIRFVNESLRKEFLESANNEKMDDLADCFLQALWYGQKKVAKFTRFDPVHYTHYEGRKKRKREEVSESDDEKESEKPEKESDEEESLIYSLSE